MTKVMIDANVQSKLDPLTEPAEICDGTGRTLGVFCPVPSNTRETGLRSPYPAQEIERRRQHRNGRSLAEIWQSLEQKGPATEQQ